MKGITIMTNTMDANELLIDRLESELNDISLDYWKSKAFTSTIEEDTRVEDRFIKLTKLPKNIFKSPFGPTTIKSSSYRFEVQNLKNETVLSISIHYGEVFRGKTISVNRFYVTVDTYEADKISRYEIISLLKLTLLED